MNGIGAVVLTVIGLVSLWLLLYFGVRPYRLDLVRFQLFTLRNELFMFAANGQVAFDDPAYTALRNRINALIRFAHIITVGRILIIGLVERSLVDTMAKKHKAEWDAALSPLGPNERALVEDIQKRVHLTVAKHVMTGNPIILIAFYVCVYFLGKTRRAEDEQIRFANKLRVDILEEQASIAQRQEAVLAELQPA